MNLRIITKNHAFKNRFPLKIDIEPIALTSPALKLKYDNYNSEKKYFQISRSVDQSVCNAQ